MTGRAAFHPARFGLRRPLLRLPVAILTLLLPACGPRPDSPLPSKDDLYVYSLAVVEKAMLQAPGQKARGLFYLGQVHQRFGFEDRALEEYRRAIEADADLGAAYQSIGFILSQRGDRMAEAIDAYQQTLRCNPGASGIYTRLGLIFLHQDRPADALEALQQEILQETASAETQYHVGQACSKLGKTSEAIQALREALRLDPDMRSAQYALARELKVAGDASGAEASLARFRELKEAEDAAAGRREQTKSSRARERRFAAEAWLDAGDLLLRAASAGADSGSPDAEGPVRKRSQELAAASLTALEEALRIDETYDDAWSTYVRLLESRGRLGEAFGLADQGRREAPSSGVWPYRVALLQKRLANQGDDPVRRRREAVALLETATQSAPDLAGAHYELAVTVLMELKSQEVDLLRRAVEHAKRAVELEPSPTHYDILALAYHRTGQIEPARRTLEEGIRRNPGASNLVHRLELLRKSLERPR